MLSAEKIHAEGREEGRLPVRITTTSCSWGALDFVGHEKPAVMRAKSQDEKEQHWSLDQETQE